MDVGTSREMPKYVCHKEVWALKIKAIEVLFVDEDDSVHAIITPEEEGYAPFKVDEAYLNKHKPLVGGYYVLYKGGYQSFSPAKEFEEGYTQLV
jgi:hypothetical protein